MCVFLAICEHVSCTEDPVGPNTCRKLQCEWTRVRQNIECTAWNNTEMFNQDCDSGSGPTSGKCALGNCIPYKV